MVKDLHVADGDDVTITNDPDKIAEAQSEDNYDDPDHRPDDDDGRLGAEVEDESE